MDMRLFSSRNKNNAVDFFEFYFILFLFYFPWKSTSNQTFIFWNSAVIDIYEVGSPKIYAYFQHLWPYLMPCMTVWYHTCSKRIFLGVYHIRFPRSPLPPTVFVTR
uniref:Uncharacterized protein n=1 Tax=Octopus bimaculoides TaxID=37653 RepID=A0A0L8FPM0_OCTBM